MDGPSTDPIVEMYEDSHEPIHLMFGLTYSNYLVLHRTLMQSMPVDWQRRFVRVHLELERAFDHLEGMPSYYVVTPRSDNGRFMRDPVPHYNRGRAHVAPRISEGA